ncbi:glycosyltransferase [Citricoccus muralis]|uniref:D-inositol 3-phosphate glycosyltransferase n=1 Tax=Citricoccus muralis TaxID=169134 RepID=A0A3D9LBZ4_9MICC|nr:glycosyltransferase [Citricoccus muralis]REE03775.1 glycosyltransferase involved in cell wall biosynthesis [Citricoccus muralis]
MSHEKGVVWKETWLGHSETFIRDQLATMESWDFLKMGFHQTEDPLLTPDFAPYGRRRLDKLSRQLLGTSLHRSRYASKIKDFDASLVHAHFLSGGMTIAPLSSELRLPLVTTLHNPRVTPKEYGVPDHFRGVYRHRLSGLMRSSCHFVAVSRYVADAVIAAGLPRNRVDVIHIGTPIVPQVFSDSREGIIFVGRLIEMKGPMDLLRAVDSLPAKLRRVPVTIVGDGPLRSELEKFSIDAGLNVQFTGWLATNELPEILSSQRIFCAPSKADSLGVREGFGMVYLEAALQGLPCVAYKSGGVVDAVQDGQTGLLVAEGDILALSRELESLLRDEAGACQLGWAGRQRAEQQFDIKWQSHLLETLLSNTQ